MNLRHFTSSPATIPIPAQRILNLKNQNSTFKMQKLNLCIAVAVFIAISGCPSNGSPISDPDTKTYDGYKVYTVTLKSKIEAAIFENFKATLHTVDTWRAPTPTTSLYSSNGRAATEYRTDVMVPADLAGVLEDYLNTKGYPYSVMIEDVGALAEEQARENLKAKSTRAATITWDAYYRYDEVIAWFDEIVANHSDIATPSIIGYSTENRALKMVKISKPGSPANKTAILIDGTFHAREWISPAVVTYVLNELLNNRAANTEVLDAVDIYIVPFVNPDGYEFTKTNNRLFRKTRSNHNSILGCRGVDPNRNFDFNFGGPGTSNDKCSEIYHGPEAFSEPETAALRDVLTDPEINFVSYLTLHSYGQWWLTPWSAIDELPEDYDDLMRFANLGKNALTAVHNTKYLAGATTEILGMTAGCSDDWSKAIAGIKYANTIEMRDTGTYGFQLPARLIQATAEETWAGIRAVTLYDFDSVSDFMTY